MTEGGHSGNWAGQELPDALTLAVGGIRPINVEVPSPATKPEWKPHPDAIAKEDVPPWTVHEMPPFESKVFDGTTRDWSIYVPAQYKQGRTCCADDGLSGGQSFAGAKGRWRVPIVFDNLICSWRYAAHNRCVYLTRSRDVASQTRRPILQSQLELTAWVIALRE